MSSNKQKRKLLKSNRILKQKKKSIAQAKERLINGNAILVDASKIVSVSWMPSIPQYYEDYPFMCKDCGSHELWTAQQQKWWHEEAGGILESVAIRCRSCRVKKREHKAAQIKGLTQKN